MTGEITALIHAFGLKQILKCFNSCNWSYTNIERLQPIYIVS